MILFKMEFDKNFTKNIWITILNLLLLHKFKFFLTIICFFLLRIIEPYVIPSIFGYIIDLCRVLDKSILIPEILQYFYIYITIWIFYDVLQYSGWSLYNCYTPEIERTIRSLMFKKIQNNSYDFFLNNNEGLLSKSIDILAHHMIEIVKFLVKNIPGFFVFIFIFIRLTLYDWKIGLCLLLWTIIHTFISIFFIKKIRMLSFNQTDIHSRLNSFFIDNFKNQKTKDFFNLHNISKEELDVLQEQDFNNFKEYNKTIYKEKIIKGIVCTILQGICVNVLLFKLYYNNVLTFGEFVAIININNGVVYLAWKLFEDFLGFFFHIMKCDSVLHFINNSNEDIKKHKNIKIIKPIGDISINDISFSYNDSRRIINNFSIKIKNNEKILILGYSGIGKTTLIDIISGLIHNYSGNIFIDNVNIKSIDRDFFANYATLITNNGLLSGSIAYNITLEKNNINDPKIYKKLKKMMKDVNLPESYLEQEINSSNNQLSEGEKQRILIARGLWRSDSKIIFGDEIFKSLDFNNRKNVKNIFLDFIKNKTAIVIDHNLDLVDHFDRIIFFGKNNNIHIDNFNNLKKNNKEFQEFIESI